MASIAIVVVSFNTCGYLVECLEAIERHADGDVEIIVVDNASTDGSPERVRKDFPRVRLIASTENIGFGAANNLGVAAATAPWLMLLNSDAVLLSDTAGGLVSYLEAHPGVACAGPRIVLPGSLALQPKTYGHAPTPWRVLMQSLGVNRVLPTWRWSAGIDGEHRVAGDWRVDWISGVCMAMRTADYRAVGGFDVRFFMYCEDIDLCLRLAPLGTIVRVDDHQVLHHGGVSSKTVAQKVRNTVWQQRHLLMILRDRDGTAAALVAHLFVAFGMVLRLLAGLARIPASGVRDNETLRSAWCRLQDVFRFGAITRS